MDGGVMNGDEVKILAMPMGAKIDANGLRSLLKKGVVIVTCEDPEKVRLLRPATDVDILPANEFLWSAVEALSAEISYNDSDKIRRRFIKNMSDKLGARVTMHSVAKEIRQVSEEKRNEEPK
jgi:hypothetical protein